MKKLACRLISTILIINICFISNSFSDSRPYITLGDREYLVKYSNYTRINNQIEGYNPELNYPLAQFTAYLASQSYRNPESLKKAALVDSSNKYFGEILQKNNFADIQLVHSYDTDRIYMDTFLKSYGGLWRFIKRGSSGEIDIKSPSIQTLAKSSTQAIVGYKWIYAKGKKRRVVSITFRGTEGLNDIDKLHEDWLISALSKKISFVGGGKIHRGYYACALAFEEKESDIYLGNKTLKEVISESRDTGDIIVLSGHSSGGSIASIYAAMLINRKDQMVPRDQIQIYSFGSPPFADKDFSKIYSSSINADKLLNLHRIVERFDIIPYSSRGAKFKIYTKDAISNIISENKMLKKSKTLKKMFKTENPEFRQIGYTEEFEDGEKVDSKENSKEESVSKAKTIDKLYFFIEEATNKKMLHHTMSWYISVLNKEAIKHYRGELSKPEIFYRYQGNSIFIYTLENADIYYSFDSSQPTIKRSNKINKSGYLNIEGEKILTLFAIDSSGNMSSIKSIAIKKSYSSNKKIFY